MLETAYKPFELPGKAYYKAAGLNLPDDISLRYMTVKEIKYFSELSSVESFADKIVLSCLKDKIDIDQLLVGDRVYLFYMVRALTMDHLYGFDIDCSECGKLIQAETDLFEMPVKTFDPNLTVPLSMTLPKSGKNITFTLPTRKIEKEVEAESKKFKQDFPQGEPNEIIYTLKRIIKSVEGLEGADQLLFIENMHYLDWRALDKQISTVSPGLDLEGEVECSYCHYSNKVKFSIHPKEFFRLEY